MTAAARSRTPSADVTSKLLDAAAEILETEGPDALSIRRIASRAGVAPMGVYNHFDSKAGIMDALFARSFSRLATAMESLDEIDDPLEALLVAGERYRALALSHPEAYRLMFQRSIKGFEPSDEAKQVALDSLAQLVRAVTRAIDTGALAPRDPMMATQMLWASCHGWVTLELDGLAGFLDSEEGARQMRSLVVDALTRSPTAARS